MTKPTTEHARYRKLASDLLLVRVPDEYGPRPIPPTDLDTIAEYLAKLGYDRPRTAAR